MKVKFQDKGVTGRLWMVIGVIIGIIGLFSALYLDASFGLKIIILGVVIYYIAQLIVWIKTGEVSHLPFSKKTGERNKDD